MAHVRSNKQVEVDNGDEWRRNLEHHKQVFVALEAILRPPAISPHNPNALRLFAHLTLVSDMLGRYAHDTSTGGSEVFDGYTQRATMRGPEMRKLSLDLRRDHLKTYLQNSKVPLTGIQQLLDAYFPLLTVGADHSNHLYISYDNDRDEIGKNRTLVTGWMEDAAACERASQPRPTFGPKPRLALYTQRMLELANETVKDMDTLAELLR